MHVLSSRKVSFQLPRRVSSPYMEQKHLIRIIKEVSLLSLQLPLWNSMVYTTDGTFGQTSLILIIKHLGFIYYTIKNPKGKNCFPRYLMDLSTW